MTDNAKARELAYAALRVEGIAVDHQVYVFATHLTAAILAEVDARIAASLTSAPVANPQPPIPGWTGVVLGDMDTDDDYPPTTCNRPEAFCRCEESAPTDEGPTYPQAPKSVRSEAVTALIEAVRRSGMSSSWREFEEMRALLAAVDREAGKP